MLHGDAPTLLEVAEVLNNKAAIGRLLNEVELPRRVDATVDIPRQLLYSVSVDALKLALRQDSVAELVQKLALAVIQAKLEQHLVSAERDVESLRESIDAVKQQPAG